MDWVAETDLGVELPGIHTQSHCSLFHYQNVLGDGHIAEDLAYGPHLVVFVLFEAGPVDEVASIIGEVAGGKVLAVSNKAKAEGTVGVDVPEVGGVGHAEKALGYGVSELGIDEIMMSVQYI